MFKTQDGHKCTLAEIKPGSLDNKIIRKRFLSETNVEMEIYAPLIANSAKPGQFIVICGNANGERFPLTISGTDKEKGTICIIFQMVGRSTIELGHMNEGDIIMALAGPLGMPSGIKNYGNCVVIGGGVGTAIAYPVAKALKDAGISTGEIDEVILVTENSSYYRCKNTIFVYFS